MDSSPEQSTAPRKRNWLWLLIPPVGAIGVWFERGRPWWRRLLGTLWYAFASLVYLGLLLFILVQTGVFQLEWAGGFPPVLTRKKTLPNYEALERDRHQHAVATNAVAKPTSAASHYWSGFRGPDRNGVYAERAIRTNWPSAGLKPMWKQPIGGGYASFAVADGRAFTIEQRRDQEAITAYELSTGHELWAQAYPARFDESMGGEGPRATPSYADGRLYALGATGEFHCLEAATGRVLWRKNILAENRAQNLTWAQSASPLLVDGKVIVCPGGPSGHSIVAYHPKDGSVLWTALDDAAAYSSPVVFDLAGQRQLIVVVQNRVVGLKVEDGALLWEYPWVVQMNNRNIAQPVRLSDHSFLLSAGYGTGCAAVEVIRKDNSFAVRELWRNKYLKNKFSSSIELNGYVYGQDEDVLTCLEAATGKRQWKDGHYGYGQLLLAGQQLIILCGNGDLAVGSVSPVRWTELVRFPAISGKTWNHPALADGILVVRNAVEMAAFDVR